MKISSKRVRFQRNEVQAELPIYALFKALTQRYFSWYIPNKVQRNASNKTLLSDFICVLNSLQMWKSVVGHNVNMKVAAEGDDWETDPDFEVPCTSWFMHRLLKNFFDADFVFQNDVSEQEQRWGAKTIEGSGRTKEHIR